MIFPSRIILICTTVIWGSCLRGINAQEQSSLHASHKVSAGEWQTDFASQFQTLALDEAALQNGLTRLSNQVPETMRQLREIPSAAPLDALGYALVAVLVDDWGQAERWLAQVPPNPAASGVQLLRSIVAMATGKPSARADWLTIYAKEPRKSLLVLHFLVLKLYSRQPECVYRIAACLASSLKDMAGWREDRIMATQVKGFLQQTFHLKIKNMSRQMSDFSPENLNKLIEKLKRDAMIRAFDEASPKIIYVLEMEQLQPRWRLHGALLFEDFAALEQRFLVSYPADPVFSRQHQGSVLMHFR